MKTLLAADFERICEQQLFKLPYFRAMLRAVEQRFYAEMNLPGPILDIGAGDGHFAESLFGNKSDLAGIDPWLAPLQEASSRRVYVLLAMASGAEIPFPDKSFDTAISNSVLEHIPGVQPVLNQVYAKLKLGGQFLFAVPNQRFRTDLWGMMVLKRLGLGKLAPAYSAVFNRVARHVNLDPPEVWTERLTKAGFGDVQYFHYFPREALHILERGHLGGIPNLIAKKLLGKWVLWPSRRNPHLRFKYVRRLIENPFTEEGACTFYIATRTS